ncbi:hypothetical protein F511_36166 [Dorcoceras hygrometricum]|uniref:Uncharacterized protein n=1 Tax=Dorcoceras hygrometricum TaxID=472368 RepID=A0A2Z7ACB8_9LAMI|nr:hypothetical protein F511_36166 [Dorcoceras hygrometricum]
MTGANIVDKEMTTVDEMDNIIAQVITETAQMDTDVEEPVGSRADSIPEIGETVFVGTVVGEPIVQRSDETEDSIGISFAEFAAIDFPVLTSETDRMFEMGSITDSACKNQLVVVSVRYGPFNPYIPIRSMTIGKSRVTIDPIAIHTSWRSNSDIASVTSIGYQRMSANGESSTTMHQLLHASMSHPILPPDDPKKIISTFQPNLASLLIISIGVVMPKRGNGSSRPQPPPDDQRRPSGGSGSIGSGGDGSSQRRGSGGSSKKRHSSSSGGVHHSSGGGGPVGPIRRDAEYWICGKRKF